MKLTPRRKKLLILLSVVVLAVVLTGCTAPVDENGKIILITQSTTFSEVFKNESWFTALFVFPLSWCINKLTPMVGVGAAITLVTLAFNALLGVLTLKSTVGAQKIQLIQPEMERIQRKYEGRNDDASKMRMATELQNLYTKNHINPLGSMLVQFVQLPIIMAMYMAVQRSEAVATGTFLGMDLQISSLNGMKGMFHGDMNGFMFLLLFLFMALCQYLSMKIPMFIQKRKAEKEAAKHHRKPQVAQNTTTNKVMQIYMMVMILIFGLTLPAAMSLYWAINSLVNILKMFLVQKYIDNTEKKEGKLA